MPVVAAAAAAVFSSAVTFATAVGTAALTSVGLGSLATMGIASFTGSLTIGAVVGAVSIGSTAMSIFSMARKPKAGASSPSPIAFKADPNAYLHYVAGGPVGVGGNQVFAQTSGSKNKYLTYTTALSAGGPVHSVQPFKANDTVVNFGANGGAGATGTYSNRMWQKFALGAVIGATALTMGNVTGNRDTPGNNGGHPYEWTPQHTLPSIAHTLWTLLSDPDKYPQLPKPLWEVRGGPVYDPRKDSTFPGGNGPQRWNDRNTWSTEGNQNPFLQALTYCIGHTFNGVRLGGVGVPVQMIDVPRFVEGANVADANGWKIAWVWNTGMRKWDVLTGMLQAGGGTPLVRGSKISCMVEAPRVSIGVVTDADIMGPVSITGTTNKRDRKNTIIPRCKSAAHKWTVQPFGAVTAATYLAEDKGIERPEEIEYESIADNGDGGRQLRQIAAYDLANMREGLGGVLPLPMKFMKYRAGDCLTVNAPKTLLNGQKVLILKREVDTRSKRVSLTVRSETDGKHDFALGRTADAPPAPSLTGVDPTVVQPPAPEAWVVEPGQTPGGGGQEGGMPVVVITPADPDPNNPGGAHGDDPAATNVVVRYRREGTNPATGVPWPWVQEEFPATSPKIELKGLAPLTTYEVEMAYRVRGIVGLWQPYGLVTTQSLIATNALALGNRDAQAILDDLDAIPAIIDAAVGELDAAVQLAIGNINAAVAQIEADIDDPTTGLKVRVGTVEGVAADAASRVSAVEVSLTAPGTGILARTASLETATANLQTGKADASRVTTLEGQVNTPGTGLLARATSLETATANLQTGKADAARVTNIETALNAPGTGLTARVGTLETATVNLQTGKADASRVTVLEAQANGFNKQRNPRWLRGWDAWPTRIGPWGYSSLPGGDVSWALLGPTTTATSLMYGEMIPWDAGQPIGLSGRRYVNSITSGVLQIYVGCYDAAGNSTGSVQNVAFYSNGYPAGQAIGAQNFQGQTGQVTPPGTTQVRVQIEAVNPSAGAYLGLYSVMLSDDPRRAFSDDASAESAQSKIATLEIVTANLQTGKADASRVTVLESRVQNIPNLLLNSDFSQNLKYWTVGGGIWSTYKDPAWGSLAGGLGGDAGATYYLISDLVRVYGGAAYTISFNGDGGAAPALSSVYCSQYDAAGNYIPAGDGLGAVNFVGVDWLNRKSTTFVTRPDTVFLKVVVAKSGQHSPGQGLNTFISRIMLSSGLTSPGWNDDATARDSWARVTTTEQATTDLYGRTRARWALGTAVPGAEAFMQAQAETTPGQAPTSSVAIGAQQFAVYNQVGQNWLKALEVVGGNVLLSGGLQAGAFIRLGNGNGWPVALKPVDFNVSDGEVVSFGTDLGGLPALGFAQNNLAPLNAGETYDVRASGLTATGFTLYAKINVPSAPSNQTANTVKDPTTLGGYPGVQLYLDGKPESVDGTYRVQANGVQTHRFMGKQGQPVEADSFSYANTTLLVWAYKGTWVQVAQLNAESVADPYQFPSFQTHTTTAPWAFDETIQMGSGVTHVAVVRVGADNGLSGNVSTTGPVSWQSQGAASGVRSATPNGQKTRVTVRPQ